MYGIGLVMHVYDRIKASIKIKQVYTCSLCTKQELGDTRRLEIVTHSPELLKFKLDNIPLKAHYMPVGWANSFDTGFVCQKCKHID